MREKLNRWDWIFLGVCGVIFAAGLAIGIAFFDDAFPEAAIDFKYDRNSSRDIAEKLLAQQKVDVTGYRHAAMFGHDDEAKIFLERKLGLEKTNELTKGDVRVWYWRHRWFRPLEIEEVRVRVAPTGEIVSYFHKIPEDRAAPNLERPAEQATAEAFLRSIGIAPEKLQLVSRSEQALPKRKDVTYEWDSRSVRPAGATYRYSVVLHGDVVGAFTQYLKVPDQWSREYEELRSKNIATQLIDQIFMALTIIAALAIFVVRLRRGDVQIRLSLGAGLIGALLFVAVEWNELPSALANYDTSQSFPAFIAGKILLPILQGLFAGMLLAVLVGAGEALYRERLPGQLAMPRVVSRRSLTSKRVFKGFILGYTLFAAFFAYQAIFYLVAERFGAWAPAEIPYTSILNSAFPWAAVLFMGFFPAVSEEFMSRAFSIPFFEKWLRSPLAAIIVAGFIWGFGHSAYPNQPFYIRGLEVGIAGVIMGLLMYRFGILGLLVWHYTVDALYTSFLLFRSGNAYYIFSAGLASLIFIIPTIVAIALYIKNRGFIPDDDLNNAAIGTVAPVEHEVLTVVEEAAAPAVAVSRRALLGLGVAVILAIAAVVASAPTLDDIINYRIPKREATEIARRHLAAAKVTKIPPRSVPRPDAGFRSWNPNAGGEDGGGPEGYDHAALWYLMRRATQPIERVLQIEKEQIEAATWVIRFFEPGKKEEILVEVDPRTSRVTGFHRLLEEEAPGPALEESAAEPIARGALASYGLNAADFERKESLSYQQPKRRDWLFHYQEKTPLVAEAYRRASVRVAGDQVSQFAKTIKIPERDRRDFEKETLFNTILMIARILAAVVLLGIVIYGVVAATRVNHFAWKPATKWALPLIPVSIVAIFLHRDLLLGLYDTSIPWNTWMIVLVVASVFRVAFEVGMLWLSFAILETVFPRSRRLIGREGARRFGAAAVVAALTAGSIFVVSGALMRSAPRFFPDYAPLKGLDAPAVVLISLPALAVVWQAFLAAFAVSAGIAGFYSAVHSTPPNRRLFIQGTTFVSLLLVAVDSSARLEQMPLAFLLGLAGAAVLYATLMFVLRDNLLAYPLTFFTIPILSGAASMLQNDRLDLRINAIILITLVLAVLSFYLTAGRRPTEVTIAESVPTA